MAGWEKLTEENAEKTDRLRITGGWLYRTRSIFTKGSAPALVFVPDPPPEPAEPPPAPPGRTRKTRAKAPAPALEEEVDDGAPVRWDPKK